MANLSDDVLQRVFNLAIEFENYNYKSWTKQLVLLSVCQKWRHCALPLVCHYAGFYFKGPDQEYMDLESMEDSLVTNFDKMMTIGHPSLVKHLDIRMYFTKNAFTCIMLVLNRLSDHFPVWSSLREIRILSISDIRDNNINVDEALALSCQNKTMVNKIAKMMPNIVKLEFQDFNNNVSKIFCGRLADLYAQNLKTLISFKPIPLNDINSFCRLTNLQVGCENNPSFKLPLAYIGTLEFLKLHDLPGSLQWYNVAQNQSNKVVFSNLRKLELEYESSDSSALSANSVDYLELHFPKLKYLTIVNPSEHQPLLSHSVFGSELEVVDMFSRMDSLNQLTRFKLPSIKRLRLHAIFINHGGLGSALNTLSKVAKVAQVIDNLCLTINNEAPMDLTGCNAYPPLTSLDIYNIENYEHLFGLVQRLPRLKKLTLHAVDTDNINNEDILFLLGNQQGVAPVSSSVEYVQVSYSDRFSSQTAIRFTTLLLVGLPALKKLSAYQINKDILLGIINKRKARYPRLGNVQVFDSDEHLS